MWYGIIFGFLFVGSIAWFWVNLPGGDYIQFFLSIFDAGVRSDLLATPFDPLSSILSGLLLATVVGVFLALNLFFEEKETNLAVGIFVGAVAIDLPLAALFAGYSSTNFLYIVSLIILAIIAIAVSGFSSSAVLNLFDSMDYGITYNKYSFYGAFYRRLTISDFSRGSLITAILLTAIWLFIKIPSPGLPLHVQIARLERTVVAQEYSATQAPLLTATAISANATSQVLQATLNTLSSRLGTQPAIELATVQAEATQRAQVIVASQFQPTQDVRPTIIALQQTMAAPTGNNQTSQLRSIITDNVFQFSVATLIGIVGLVLAALQLRRR